MQCAHSVSSDSATAALVGVRGTSVADAGIEGVEGERGGGMVPLMELRMQSMDAAPR